MHTEDEARTKWCPFVRYAAGDAAGANRWKQSAPPEEPHALNPVPCRCIASECMAWKWREGDYDVGGFTGRSDNPARGFCGLARN